MCVIVCILISLIAINPQREVPLKSFSHSRFFPFCYRAYIHQYIKYGISEEDFLDSFTSLEQVISSYSQLR